MGGATACGVHGTSVRKVFAEKTVTSWLKECADRESKAWVPRDGPIAPKWERVAGLTKHKSQECV